MQPHADRVAAFQRGPFLIAIAALIGLGVVLSSDSWRPPALLVVGAALGAVLLFSSFGFAAAYRRFLLHREGEGVIAQLLMLAVATALFAPALASGEAFGAAISGSFAPVGVSVAAGALMFGVGMQLAGGCGSGTLFALGAGSARMGLVLAFFCAGAFAASLHMSLWERLPSWQPIVLGQRLGWTQAAVLQIASIAVLALVLLQGWRVRFSHILPSRRGLLFGPWPIAFGAIMLAALNFATLLIAGHPWSITWAFTLWGAKAALLVGWRPDGDPFWSAGFQRVALDSDILHDSTSIMDIGMVFGALFAAGLAARFSLGWKIAPRPALAAVLGGVLMGYGARIAYGCNVGAFFSGVASTSLHGWLWIVAALVGSAIGVRLRPLFALSNELRPSRPAVGAA